MKRLPQGVDTPEFRVEPVRLVIEQKMSVPAAARPWSLAKSSLNDWVCAARAGERAAIGKDRRPPSEVELEWARLRKEWAETKRERDRLKKCAAYFAKESR